MAHHQPDRPRDDERDEVSAAEIEDEQAAELPDREAMSVISPSPGLPLRPFPTDLWSEPVDFSDPEP